MDRVKIGFVVRAHGVRGEVRVRADELPDVDQIEIGGRLFELENVRADKDEYLLTLAGIRDRDAADALRGKDVTVPRSTLPPLAVDEIYVADLVGCAVVDLRGERLGEVIATEFTGAQELLTV